MYEKKTVFCYALAVGIVLFCWQAASLWLALPVIPPPALVIEALPRVFAGEMALHAAYSLWRIAAGLVLAIAVGVPLGVLMGYCPRCDRLLAPLVYVTYPVPKIALLPIVMLLAGLGETSKIWMLFLIIVFQVVVAVRDAVKGIPKETFDSLYSLGAGFWPVFREILWPAALPHFLTAVRVAMATAVSVLFFTETFGTQYGMGYFIMDAWLRVNYIDMYGGIMALSLMGMALFASLDALERIFCRWQMK